MAEKMVTVTKAMVRPFLREMAREDVELGLELWDSEAMPTLFEKAASIANVAVMVRRQVPDSIEVEVPDGE